MVMADIVISAAGPRNFARPKSSSLTSGGLTPSSTDEENDGYTSRCAMPLIGFVQRISDIDDLQHVFSGGGAWRAS